MLRTLPRLCLTVFAHLSKIWTQRRYRLKFWPRHTRTRLAAQEALAAAKSDFQALHLAYSTAAAHQETQARRLDLKGDFSMLTALCGGVVSLIITVVTVANGASPFWFAIPIVTFLFPLMFGIHFWMNAEFPEDSDTALRHSLEMFGGLEHFPATIWASHNDNLLRTFPLFRTLFSEYFGTLVLNSKESEVFHQLLADGFEGPLRDLVTTARSLAS